MGHGPSIAEKRSPSVVDGIGGRREQVAARLVQEERRGEGKPLARGPHAANDDTDGLGIAARMDRLDLQCAEAPFKRIERHADRLGTDDQRDETARAGDRGGGTDPRTLRAKHCAQRSDVIILLTNSSE